MPSWSFAGGLYGSRRSTNEVVVAVWLVRLFRKIVTTAAVRVVVGTNELQPTPTRGGRRPVQLAAHGIGAGRDNEENPLGWSTGTELLVSAGGTIPPGTNCLGSNRSVCNEDQLSHSCCAACGRCAGRSLNVAAASRDLPASCGHAAAGTGHSKAAPAAASDTRARMVRSAAQTHWIANPRSSVESGKNQAIGRKYFSLRLGQRKEQQTADEDQQKNGALAGGLLERLATVEIPEPWPRIRRARGVTQGNARESRCFFQPAHLDIAAPSCRQIALCRVHGRPNCEQQEQAESRLMAHGSIEYSGGSFQTRGGRGAAPARLLRIGDAGVDMPHLAKSFGARRRQTTQGRIESILAAGTRASSPKQMLSLLSAHSQQGGARRARCQARRRGVAREAQRPALAEGER